MATWWKKLVTAMTGEQLDRPDEDDAPLVPIDDRPAVAVPVQPPQLAAGPDHTERDESTSMARLVESVEKGLAENDARADQIVASLQRLSDAIDGLASASGTQQGDLARLLENAEAARDHAQRLREIVASLPEIATAQAESISGLDQRVEGLLQRTAAISDAVGDHARSVEDLKQTVAEVSRAVTNHQHTQTDLATHQREIAESVKGLREQSTQILQFLKAHAQTLHQLAEAPRADSKELSELIGAQTGRLLHACDELAQKANVAVSRSTTALVFSIIAAVGAIVSALGVARLR